MASQITSTEELLFQKLNQETGKINWNELQRYFAKGVVIVVKSSLDLVKVAEQFSQDNDSAIKSYLDTGEICHASDLDAKKWNELSQTFWAIVIAPWVLVQEIKK